MALWQNMNTTTSPGVSPSVVAYYDRAVLPNMMPEMVHHRDAQKVELPPHNGKSVRFRRITALPAITKPLIEGKTPDGQTMSETAFTATVKSYGGFIEATDEYNWYLLGNKHQEAAKTLADQAALSLDTLDAMALNAGLNVQYAGNKTSRGAITADDKLTFLDIKKAVRTLRRANAKPFADGYFHGIVHTDVVYDLTSDEKHWIDVAVYQDKQKIEKYELGIAYKVKFFESTNAMVFKPEEVLMANDGGLSAKADVANLPLTAPSLWDVQNRIAYSLVQSDTVVDPRPLVGKMVNLNCTVNGDSVVAPVCIENAVFDTIIFNNARVPVIKITLRWLPNITGNITAAFLEPYGGGAGDIPVYSTLVYAKDAYGSVELGGNGRNIRTIINPPGSAGANDPLEQRGTIAWKVNGYCTAILQDDFIVRIESGATA